MNPGPLELYIKRVLLFLFSVGPTIGAAFVAFSRPRDSTRNRKPSRVVARGFPVQFLRKGHLAGTHSGSCHRSATPTPFLLPPFSPHFTKCLAACFFHCARRPTLSLGCGGRVADWVWDGVRHRFCQPGLPPSATRGAAPRPSRCVCGGILGGALGGDRDDRQWWWRVRGTTCPMFIPVDLSPSLPFSRLLAATKSRSESDDVPVMGHQNEDLYSPAASPAGPGVGSDAPHLAHSFSGSIGSDYGQFSSSGVAQVSNSLESSS